MLNRLRQLSLSSWALLALLSGGLCSNLLVGQSCSSSADCTNSFVCDLTLGQCVSCISGASYTSIMVNPATGAAGGDFGCTVDSTTNINTCCGAWGCDNMMSVKGLSGQYGTCGPLLNELTTAVTIMGVVFLVAFVGSAYYHFIYLVNKDSKGEIVVTPLTNTPLEELPAGGESKVAADAGFTGSTAMQVENGLKTGRTADLAEKVVYVEITLDGDATLAEMPAPVAAAVTPIAEDLDSHPIAPPLNPFVTDGTAGLYKGYTDSLAGSGAPLFIVESGEMVLDLPGFMERGNGPTLWKAYMLRRIMNPDETAAESLAKTLADGGKLSASTPITVKEFSSLQYASVAQTAVRDLITQGLGNVKGYANGKIFAESFKTSMPANLADVVNIIAQEQNASFEDVYLAMLDEGYLWRASDGEQLLLNPAYTDSWPSDLSFPTFSD